jgi:cell division protein FtsI (penicillin-binding protein 3)
MRTPLRPLARILHARQEGLNPDVIEKENLKLRHEAMREKARGRAQFRLMILCASFVIAFGAIGARMGLMAATEPMEPRQVPRVPRSSRSAPTSPTATAGCWRPT